MLKQILLAAMLLAASPAVAQPAAPGPLLMGKGFIGPVQRGWTLADFLSLGLPLERKDGLLETERLHVYTAKLDNQYSISLTVWADNDGSISVSSRSPAFVTREGAHVGSTLAELRRTYPRGEFSKDVGEAPWLVFLPFGRSGGSNSNLTFYFDTTGIPYECFESDRNCPDFSSMKSQEVMLEW